MKLKKGILVSVMVILLSVLCAPETFYVAENHVCDYDEGVITKEPTCIYGIKTYTCKICGKEKDEQLAGVWEHTYALDQVLVEPTCTSTGISSYGCTTCTHSYKKTTDKLPHQKDGGTIVKEPTLNASGLKEYRCIVCNQVVETEIIYKDTSNVDGWLQTDGIWYYYKKGAKLCNQWLKYGGNWYYLKENGAMATGWLKDGSNWYYMNTAGVMLTNEWIFDGSWYYLGGSGAMLSDEWIRLDGKWYYLKAGGAMATGWVKYNSNWYYMDKNGVMCSNGWIYVDSDWYYLSTDGTMLSGEWILENNTWYYLKTGGQMATGWVEYQSNWYYMNKSGAMCSNGWIHDGLNWYYLLENGIMKKNTWFLNNGNWYYLELSGAMAAEKWVGEYYVTASGAMAKNQWVDDNVYYVDEDGLVVPELHQIDLGDGQYQTVYGVYNTEFEDEVIRLVNEYRIANGLKPFKKSKYLSKQADIRGYEITNVYHHTRPNGEFFSTVLEHGGTKAENIAVGTLQTNTPQAVFDAWRNSEGHNKNMLRDDCEYIGVSCFVGDGTKYKYNWVQLFSSETIEE